MAPQVQFINSQGEKMRDEKRRGTRKEFSGVISFASMTTGRKGMMVAYRNGHCKDIGSGGLGLLTPYKSTVGEILNLSVPFADLDVTVPVWAEVMWVAPLGGHYGTGVRFLT
jgi:hypothetical protein